MAENQKSAVLPESVFSVTIPNHELLKQAYSAYLANGRPNLAKTLRRGEVSGGGRKPWKQKGTGRARFGSSRNPIWRKGGIVFGPLGVENYSIRLNTASRRVAIRQALTLAAQAEKVLVVEEMSVNGKTKEMAGLLAKHGVRSEDNVVLAVEHKTEPLVRATRNMPNVVLTQASYLNVFNILNADKLIITKPAVQAIEKWLGGSTS